MIELLSPVGNKEMLYQAIHNGADAIYLAGKKYGARKFSNNFDEEEMKNAVQYSHLYNVKVYVTVNTIIYEKEIENFIEYIKFLYKIGVDALIMQDIGMIDLIHQLLPDFTIHASTQMHNYTSENIEFLKSLGVSRVVFARETAIEEIKKVKNIETEVFIHGALCISYSGCCLFSSLVGGRSGNRGECAGSCRLQYDLYQNDKQIPTEGKYLLSTKELSSINHLDSILKSNITSLKIEGRMKSPEYVGFVTSLYRKIIDAYYKKEQYKVTEEEIKKLKILYNREFTKGFINSEKNTKIVNAKTPNHIGIKIGEVISYDKKRIKIKLNDTLHQGDGIRFTSNNKGLICNYLYDEFDNLISSSNKYVYLKNTNLINSPSDVVKTFDIKLKAKLENIKEKKIKITFSVYAKEKEKLKMTISDGTNKITEESIIVEKANKKSTTKENIKEKLEKLGNTPFICENINFKMEDNLFIPISYVNNLRRTLVEKLKEKRMNLNREVHLKEYKANTARTTNKTSTLSVLARNKEQINACIEEKVDCIYVDDYKLYLEYMSKYKNIYYYIPRVNYAKKMKGKKLVVSDTASINQYHIDNHLIGSCYLNVVNSYNINYLLKYVDKVCLSVESDYNNTLTVVNNYKNRYGYIPNIEKVIYGRVDLMIMKYCPLNKFINKENTCKICQENNKYYLKDRKEEIYPIYNKNCLTTILHYKNIDERNNIDLYKSLGIQSYLIILYDEDKEKIKNIIKSII